MNRKLYNGGERLKERLHYTVKTEGKGDEHGWAAMKDIDAPAFSFFEVPDEVAAPLQGVPRVPVYFHTDLAVKHGHRGVVLVDAELGTDVDDDTPYARTEAEAVEKGDRLWHNHLVNTVQRHIQFVADMRAAGGAPRSASAFTRHALKLLNYQDPADAIFERMTVKQAQPEAPAAVVSAPVVPPAESADYKKEISRLQGQLGAEKQKTQKLQHKIDALDELDKMKAKETK